MGGPQVSGQRGEDADPGSGIRRCHRNHFLKLILNLLGGEKLAGLPVDFHLVELASGGSWWNQNRRRSPVNHNNVPGIWVEGLTV